jgi:hypothetical protein
MDAQNLLILTVYIIVVLYVFYKAHQSLDTQVVIDPDKDFINEQIEKNGLKDIVDINFSKLRPSYQLDDLKTIPITIINKSDKGEAPSLCSLLVDWDQSSLTDIEDVTGRVILVTKGLTEVPQQQAKSVLAPGQKLQEELSDAKDLSKPLFKTNKLKKAAQTGKPFFLRIFLLVSYPGEISKADDIGKKGRTCFVRCKLTPKKLRWSKALVIAFKPRKPKNA